MPSYSYVSLADVLGALSSRLYDPTFQQWTQVELTGYVAEALRTWNALSGFWKGEFSFPLQQGVTWYDLRQQQTTLIGYNVDQLSIIKQVENHLLEPPTTNYPLSWGGSPQFSMADILYALERRQNDTLGETGCTLAETLIPAPLQLRNNFSDTVLDIRRISWIPTGTVYFPRPLQQGDKFSQRTFNPFQTTSPPRPPSTWIQNTEGPVSFDVDSIPPVPGQYDLLAVVSGPAWTATLDKTLSIPDDWSWVFKWGALADLFSREADAKDSIRAEYCQKRYLEGLALLDGMTSILSLRLNNIPINPEAVYSADKFNPGWQSPTQGPPTKIYSASDMIAVSPMPDAGGYSVTAYVVRNAPIPASPTDNIQVGRDDLDSIIDYAHHLAMLKQGGSEFTATIPLYQKLQRQAALYNGKLEEMGFFGEDERDLGRQDEMQNPRYSPGKGPSSLV